jgi:release factor glutamine methyltransferase
VNQENPFNRLLDALTQNLSVLPDKSEENAENTLCALWQTAAGKPMSPITAQGLPLPALSAEQFAALELAVQSRLAGVPLAHLTERQHFMGLEYIVNKGLYIPRKETELLAQTAIATVAEDYASNGEVTAVDLCTGIGTVALAIAHHCGNTRVFGSDIYAPAIEAAKVNATHFGLAHRASFFNADLFEPFESLSLKSGIDIIVSAPPYISSVKVKDMATEIAQHEPKEAFDAGPFGLSVFNKIIALAPDYLRPGGCLIFECGLGQGEFLAKRILANKHYERVTEVLDELGQVRVLKAIRRA